VTEEEGKKPFPCFGAKLLLDYLVPLATYFIKSEKTGGKSQTVLDNLVDSSIKARFCADLNLSLPSIWHQVETKITHYGILT